MWLCFCGLHKHLCFGLDFVLDEVSFAASDKAGQKIKIDKNYVKKNLGDLVKDTDLSKFIL